jgi:hypothetical protein
LKSSKPLLTMVSKPEHAAACMVGRRRLLANTQMLQKTKPKFSFYTIKPSCEI